MQPAACYNECAGTAGEQRLFSEQQLMDCSWGHTHNKACDGGLYEGAYHYLTRGEGVPLALESDYPCEFESHGRQPCCTQTMQICRL
jgi:Papain family cysteine protease